jgi:hypothetical protein
MIMYNTEVYWGFGFCPSSGILNNISQMMDRFLIPVIQSFINCYSTSNFCYMYFFFYGLHSYVKLKDTPECMN